MNLATLPLNWYDLIFAVILVVGLYRGKKRGMSQEMFDLAQWLVIVFVTALVYQPLGQRLMQLTSVSTLTAHILAYVFFVIFVKLTFTWIKRMAGEKLVQSDLFGSMEYYFGMAAGTLRFACMILMSLALLHAKHISAEELAAQAKMQKDNFGDISFPTLGSIQHGVFQDSATGILVKKHLRKQLIVAVPGANNQRASLQPGRQRVLDELIKK